MKIMHFMYGLIIILCTGTVYQMKKLCKCDKCYYCDLSGKNHSYVSFDEFWDLLEQKYFLK